MTVFVFYVLKACDWRRSIVHWLVDCRSSFIRKILDWPEFRTSKNRSTFSSKVTGQLKVCVDCCCVRANANDWHDWCRLLLYFDDFVVFILFLIANCQLWTTQTKRQSRALCVCCVPRGSWFDGSWFDPVLPSIHSCGNLWFVIPPARCSLLISLIFI